MFGKSLEIIGSGCYVFGNQNRTYKPLCDFGVILAIYRRGMRYNPLIRVKNFGGVKEYKRKLLYWDFTVCCTEKLSINKPKIISHFEKLELQYIYNS